MSDDDFEEAIHAALVEDKKLIFHTTILNQDSQRLATGEALIKGARGVFWPENPSKKDIPPSNTAILRRSDGTDIRISDFRLCGLDHYSVHYHFRT
jgi:hypothetical protein